MNLLRDPKFTFFAAGAALALIISAPNTYQMAAPLHSDGSWFGVALTIALVVLLEAGAVGAEIAGVRLLCWLLLGLTFAANAAIGSVYLDNADLTKLPSLLSVRTSGRGWLLVLGYAAIVPVLLYTFLHYAIKRAQELAGQRSPAQELAHQVADRVVAILPMAAPLALPAQPIYAAPREVPDEQRTAAVTTPQTADRIPDQPAQRNDALLTPNTGCAVCGEQPSAMQRRTAQQHGAWRCKNCGHRTSVEA